jgi:hypothetical protein
MYTRCIKESICMKIYRSAHICIQPCNIHTQNQRVLQHTIPGRAQALHRIYQESFLAWQFLSRQRI